jgi:hypothetical protein
MKNTCGGTFSERFKDACDSLPNSYPVFQSEIKIIKNRLPKNHIETEDSIRPGTQHLLTGLALSGGGIRSATFNLGLLQALCCERLIRRIDYLSTVSGGGYIGSCLTTLMNSEIDSPDDLLSIEGFPFSNRPPNNPGCTSKETNQTPQSEKGEPQDTSGHNESAPHNQSDGEECTAGIEKEPVRHLRYYSNYITAARNLIQKYVRPAMVFLRSMILNFTTVLPYLMAIAVILAFVFSLRMNFGWDNRFSNNFLFDLHKFETALRNVEKKTAAYRGYVLKHTASKPVSNFDDRVLILLHQEKLHKIELKVLQKNREAAEKQLSDEWRPVWQGPLVIFFSMIVLSLLFLPFYSIKYDYRFKTSHWLGGMLLFSGAILLVYLYGAMIGLWRHWSIPPELGFVSLLSLMTPKLLQAVAANDEKGKKPWGKITTTIVLLALVPLTLLFLTGIGIDFLTTVSEQGTGLWPKLPDRYAILIGSAVVLFILCAVFIDVNRISLHNFYRDRLSQAYLIEDGGDVQDGVKKAFDSVKHRDKLNLSSLTEKAPYHLINVNLNLTKKLPFGNKGSNPDAPTTHIEGIIRNGESFIFSKEWCGSEKTGYRKTASYETRDGHLDLGTAMAISGAAANVGMGLVKLPLLRMLMGLLNIRLGYWAPNPKKGSYPDLTSSENQGNNHPDNENRLGLIHPIDNLSKSWRSIYEWFLGYKLDADFINLSDGGHFENLGAYELLRRRCKYIIVGDAEADRQMSFNALSNLIRLARIDFGIIIDIDISDINPDSETVNSRNHCAVGVIHYPAVDDLIEERGYMLYCKSSLTGDEPQHLHEYRVHNPDFPHESTADQWFDERQFEMYRELGYHIGRETFAPCSSIPEIDNLENFFWELKRFWHPHSPAVEKHFSKHGKELNSIISQIKDDPDLSFLDAQIYPEWETLIRTPYRFPVSPNLWIPHDPAAIRKGFYMCSQMIHLMENVYLDLDLEHTHAHPDNAGWKNLFMHWSGAGMFRLTWAIGACTFGEKFQTFCNTRLKLNDVSEMKIERIPVNSDFNAGEKQHQLTADSKKELACLLNPVEIRKIDRYLNALKREFKELPNTCYALGLDVTEHIHKKDKMCFGFGFVLVTENVSDCRIHYLRIQDHLREMGLGQRALEKLLKSWMSHGLIEKSPTYEVRVVDDGALKRGPIQKELAENRKIFKEMLISVQTKLEK